MEVSGLVFTLAERLGPARRVDFLVTADSGATRLDWEPAVEGICIDLGLSALVLSLGVLFGGGATVLVGWLRA